MAKKRKIGSYNPVEGAKERIRRLSKFGIVLSKIAVVLLAIIIISTIMGLVWKLLLFIIVVFIIIIIWLFCRLMREK